MTRRHTGWLGSLMLLALLAPAGCGAKAGERTIEMGPVDTGPGTTASARRFLEGRWALESFHFYPPGGTPIALKGSGVLVYDDFSNLHMEIRADQASADLLRAAGIDIRDGVITTDGRTAIDLQNRTLTYVIQGQAPLVPGPLSINRPRHWVVEGDTLILTTKDDAGNPLSVGRWKRSQSALAGFASVLVWLLSPAAAEQAPPPNTSIRESTATVTVERIERASRVLTLRGKDNTMQTVYVGPEVTTFEDLKAGDVVTVRYTESVIAAVRPGAKLAPTQDTTEQARKAGDTDVLEQLRAVVRIESIDAKRHVVTYRTHDNRIIMHEVQDKALLEGIRPGDRVEITLTRARALSIERTRR